MLGRGGGGGRWRGRWVRPARGEQEASDSETHRGMLAPTWPAGKWTASDPGAEAQSDGRDYTLKRRHRLTLRDMSWDLYAYARKARPKATGARSNGPSSAATRKEGSR